jgi:hypothetical protein
LNTAIEKVGSGMLTLTTHKDMMETQVFYGRVGWVETGREGDRAFMTLDI